MRGARASWTAALLLALLLALAGRASPPAPGESLAAFTLPRAGGGAGGWKPGRISILTFVAFWCDTWKAQSERLAASRNALRGLPVDFVTVSVDGRWAERGSARFPGPVLLDSGGALSGRLGVRSVPFTLVLDERGRVSMAARGILRAADLQRCVRGLVNRETLLPGGSVYLTFDDFPAGAEDELLLDVLRAEGVPATFFCLGRGAAAARETVRRAAREGHSLQLHSWDHRAGEPQLERCSRLLEALAGTAPGLYRPPGSAALLRLGGGRESRPVVNPYDFQRPGTAELSRRVLLAAKPGSVILLHAGVGETRAALPGLVASLRKRGLAFAVLR